MAAAGTVLSQPTRATTASKRCRAPASSMESAMTSRLTSEAFMPSVPMRTPSPRAMVLNSSGVAPAARISLLQPLGYAPQVVVAGHGLVHVLATPTMGRASSSPLRPVARSNALAGARSGPSVRARLRCLDRTWPFQPTRAGSTHRSPQLARNDIDVRRKHDGVVGPAQRALGQVASRVWRPLARRAWLSGPPDRHVRSDHAWAMRPDELDVPPSEPHHRIEDLRRDRAPLEETVPLTELQKRALPRRGCEIA
jgi:hypothetical protein